MEEKLIELETAKLAKEKGFRENTSSVFIGEDLIYVDNLEDVYPKDWNKPKWVFQKDGSSCFGCKLDNIRYFEAYSVPTQSLLQKWLREEHKIHLHITSADSREGIVFHCMLLNYSVEPTEYKVIPHDEDLKFPNLVLPKIFKTYELALERGLIEALKLI